MSGAAGRGPANPPGRSRLAYRVGTYESFLRQMLDRLVMTLEHDADAFAVDRGAGRRDAPTVRLNLDDADHWLLALARSWASVADVLTFYQERLIQEGYLRTAVEERSVHDLARMVGYRPLPGVAGSTWLAVKVSEVEGLPPEISLPQRLVVRSKPPPGGAPLVFETAEPLRARAAWNRLPFAPRRLTLPPRLTADATALDLAGAAPGLVPGSPVLVRGRAGEEPVRRLVTLSAVEALPGGGAGLRWEGPLAPELGGALLDDVEVHAFDRRSPLFGHNAPPFASLPAEERRRVQPLDGGVLLYDGSGWHSRNRGLPSSSRVVSLTAGDAGHLYAGTADQGVFRSTDGGASWQPASRGLLQLDVRALAAGRRGVVYAGTAGGGVFRSTDRGAVWEPANGGEAALAGAGRRWSLPGPLGRGAVGGRLPQSPVRALLVASRQGPGVVVAGTDAGLFRTTDAGRLWQPVGPEDGEAPVAVEALAAGPSAGLLFAGTSAGVLRSTDGGRRWRPLNRGLPDTDPFRGVSTTRVHALVVLAARHGDGWGLVAGTPRGVYRWDGTAERWRAVPLGELPADAGVPVTGLTAWQDPLTTDRRLFAATAETLYESSDDGASWRAAERFPPGPVGALAAGTEGAPALAATPFGSFADRWPGFHLRRGRIDLAAAVEGLAPGSWVALEPVAGDDGAPVPEPLVHRVRGVSTVRRRDFLLDATVTRLEVEPDPRLADFDLRSTRAWVGSRPLVPAPRVEVDHGSALDVLRVALDGLPPTRRVIAAGTTPRQTLRRVVRQSSLAADLAALCDELAALQTDDPVRVRVWPGRVAGDATSNEDPAVDLRYEAAELIRLLSGLLDDPDAARAYGWLLGDAPGAPAGGAARARAGRELGRLLRRVEGSADGLATLRVDADGREAGRVLTAAELAAVLGDAAVRADAEGGRLRLPEAEGETLLVLTLDTLRVHANVVAAVEGMTVAGELLGDGDATRSNQAFPLSRAPNFRRDLPRPSSSVEVRVQGQEWHEVRRLYERGAEDRVFRLDVDHRGAARVVFGDGERGARLPTGHDNVVATYRTGMSTGRVPADGVTLPEGRPLGLDAVTNPLPTTAGAAPEPADQVRRRAPGSVRTLDRIVSLHDYADFARRFPGVARARAWSLPGAGGPAVALTVAADGGRPLEPGDDLLRELRDALEARRAAALPLVVESYRRVQVDVRARVRIDPDFVWDEVEERLRRALGVELGFPRSRFGGAISRAAVVTVLQRQRGVVAVDLDGFVAPALAPGAGERRGRPPRRRPDGGVEPAELVVLGSVDLVRMDPP